MSRALTLGTANCEASAGTPGQTLNCGPYGPAQTTVSGAVTLLSLDMNFVMAPRDTASFAGQISLNSPGPVSVPEPASALVLAWVALLPCWRRRR